MYRVKLFVTSLKETIRIENVTYTVVYYLDSILGFKSVRCKLGLLEFGG